MGADPELFLSQNGSIIGAERVIPETGLYLDAHSKPSIVLDGVQVELHPRPSNCRESIAWDLSAAFAKLRKHLESVGNIEANFRTVIEVSKDELASLSPNSRRLGCAPSNNLYDRDATIAVDPATYTKRSAGGHIHIDLNDWPTVKEHAEELVPLMDCLPGLVSVFCDRDPLASERRQVYGRAGEYRLPPYGLEYRTLSNFWLRSYPLMSLMFGLSRFAASILGTKYVNAHYTAWDAPKALLDRVDISLVRDAINLSDLGLAKRAFEPVKGFIQAHMPGHTDFGIHAHQVLALEHFFKRIEEKGLEYWFPAEPLQYWADCAAGKLENHYGSERFLSHVVTKDPA